MGKVSAALRLTRIEHSLMLIIAVLAAELISGGLPRMPILILSIITPVFISMSAFAINDFFDVKVDRANKKRRPLVTGELTKSEALGITGACALIGIVAAAMINIYCLEIAVIFALLSLLYSFKLKDLPLIGNMYVAFSMSIPFIFGDYVVINSIVYSIYIISVLVFLTGLAREIDGTIRDYKGDTKRGARTISMVIGVNTSAYFALLYYVLAVAISIEMFLKLQPFMGNAIYILLIALSDLLLLYSGLVFAWQDRRRYDQVRNASLIGMAIALVCLLLSAIVYIQIPF